MNKRLLHQYRRLLRRWQTLTAEVTVSEIAEVMFCSTRYARTLLAEMEAEGLITWRTRPGRGARSSLRCWFDEAALSVIQEGQPTPLLPMHEALTESVSDYEMPQNQSRLYIPFNRPLVDLAPSYHNDKAERHLLNMIHSGLTKVSTEGKLVPCLAHTIESIDDGRCWRFYLRDGLVWHDGSAVHTEQVRATLVGYLSNPLFQHVRAIEIRSTHCIEFSLLRPDANFAYWFSQPAFAIAHPEKRNCGLGPYKVGHHDSDYLILERFAEYYAEQPLIQSVQYLVSSNMQDKDQSVTMQSTSEYDESEEYIVPKNGDSVYLTFNNNKKTLNVDQQEFIRALLLICIYSFDRDNPARLDVDHYNIKHFDKHIPLPPSISISYIQSDELESIVDMLATQLKYRGCVLKPTPINPAHKYINVGWEEYDVSLDEFNSGFFLWNALDASFRTNPVTRAFMPDDLWQRILSRLNYVSGNAALHRRYIYMVMQLTRRHNWYTPLFTYNRKIFVPSRVRGVRITEQGWPDYSSLWLNHIDDKLIRPVYI